MVSANGVPIDTSATPVRRDSAPVPASASNSQQAKKIARSAQDESEEQIKSQILQLGQQLQQAALDNASKGGSSIFKQQPRSNATLQDGARAAAAMAAAMSSCRVSREATNDGSAASHSHAFWETQPVMQFSEAGDQKVDAGPIEPPRTLDDVRQQPYNLPNGFEWSDCDMSDDNTASQVFDLLTRNYVEDGDEMFRFKYSQPFLQWALLVPEYKPEWHVGVRLTSSKKLMAFITAIPAHVRIGSSRRTMAEINFLCVHKKLRSKRLAPVLIKEITRRVNQRGIWQAAYTAGSLLPRPVATARYWHRSLNPQKLIDVGFSRLQARMTIARTVKLYKLPDTTTTPGLRPMRPDDTAQVTSLLAADLERFGLAPVFTEADVAHAMLPRPGVITTYVVESQAGGILTDVASFYTLPSSIIGHDRHKELKAAYQYYTAVTATPLVQLMRDVLVIARDLGYDVFNALDLLDNGTFLQDLKFGIGDGLLRYYLYNWRVPQELLPQQVGLILL